MWNQGTSWHFYSAANNGGFDVALTEAAGRAGEFGVTGRDMATSPSSMD